MAVHVLRANDGDLIGAAATGDASSRRVRSDASTTNRRGAAKGRETFIVMGSVLLRRVADAEEAGNRRGRQCRKDAAARGTAQG